MASLSSEICRIGLYDQDVSALSGHLNTPYDFVDAVATAVGFIYKRFGKSDTRRSKHTGMLVYYYSCDPHVSRVMISQGERKIVSFHIPLELVNLPGYVEFRVNQRQVTGYELERLKEISECLRKQQKSCRKTNTIPTLNSAREELDSDVIESGGKAIEPHIYDLYFHILASEPGYIRYDWDEKGVKDKEQLHPLHHLDINYSPTATYKQGLYGQLKLEDFLRMFQKEEDKMYLHRYHPHVPSLFNPPKQASKKQRKLKRSTKKKGRR